MRSIVLRSAVACAVALVWPSLATAETKVAAKVPTIAFIESAPFARNCGEPTEGIQAFQQGLRDLGYVIGQTITVERRCFENSRSFHEARRLPADIMVLVGGDEDLAAHGTIRIISINGAGLAMGHGLFSTLELRPHAPEPPHYLQTDGKRLDLLRGMVPLASRFAVLTESGSTPAARSEWESVGRTFGLRIEVFDVRTAKELDSALATISRHRLEGVAIKEGSVVSADRGRVMRWIADKRLPAAFSWRRFAEEGALMSYGVDVTDLYRRFARRIDDILRGADVAKSPVEQPKLEFVINVRTAQSLGLTIPQMVLLQADRLIE